MTASHISTQIGDRRSQADKAPPCHWKIHQATDGGEATECKMLEQSEECPAAEPGQKADEGAPIAMIRA